MKRRDFCKALGFSAACGALWPQLTARAAAQPVGRAVPDGNYTLPFLSILSNTDVSHDFYYSESFFDHPATEYDHKLALVTLGMVMAAFNSAVSAYRYWVNGEAGRELNLAASYELLGFGDAVYYNYDIDTGKAGDFVGYSLARKSFDYNGQKRTLVALMLRRRVDQQPAHRCHQLPLRLHHPRGGGVRLPESLPRQDRGGGGAGRSQTLGRRVQPRCHCGQHDRRQSAPDSAAAPEGELFCLHFRHPGCADRRRPARLAAGLRQQPRC